MHKTDYLLYRQRLFEEKQWFHFFVSFGTRNLSGSTSFFDELARENPTLFKEDGFCPTPFHKTCVKCLLLIHIHIGCFRFCRKLENFGSYSCFCYRKAILSRIAYFSCFGVLDHGILRSFPKSSFSNISIRSKL